MFGFSRSTNTSGFKEKFEAIGRSQAAIEFDLDRKSLTANEKFLTLLGHALDEVRGKRHSIFVPGDWAKGFGR